MKKTMKISGLLWALLLAWGGSEAAGLGKLSVQSALGQPLRAEIELLSVSKDELSGISAKLAANETFRQARIDRVEALGGLQFAVDQRSNGQPIVRITSNVPVADPFLDVLIELNWNTGRIIREYTILLDPPGTAKPAATPSAVAAPEAARSGTKAPAETAKPMAEPTKPAAKPAPVQPGRYGPIRAGETLRSIASKVKPAGLTLEQMMVGLYQANKHAFYGNMNRMQQGRVLNVPDVATASAQSPAEARQTIQTHVAEWHAYRRKLAEVAGEAPQIKPEGQAAEGKIATKPAERAASPAASSKDMLRLSKGEPGTAGKPDAKTQERLASLEEELASRARALQEAQDRVGQLERTVQDMQKLLELKSGQVAKAPAAAPAPSEPPMIEAPAPEPAPAPAPAPEVAAPQPVPAPLPAPAPVAAPEKSWFSTFVGNPLYIGGLVAAVLLSALLWMMMTGARRRQGLNKFEDSIMTGGEFKNTAVFNTGSASAVGGSTEGSMLLTDFSRLGLGAIDSHEVDPIAEAEVYMAYGRDSQAEEILKEALNKDPARHEISLKLLEIYAARKDPLVFETTASELYASLGGQVTPVWQRAAELGRTIDPDNPLYRVASTEMAQGVEPVAAAVEAGAPEPETEALVATPDLGVADDWSIPEAASEAEAGLDFGAALEFPTAAPVADAGLESAPEAEALAPVAEAVEPAQAFDLEFEPAEFEAAPASEFEPESEPEAGEAEPSIEFTAPEPEEVAEAEPEVLAEPEEAVEIVALEAPEPESAAAATVAEEELEPALPDLDLSSIDLELQAPEVEAEEEVALAEASVELEAPADLAPEMPEELEELEAAAAPEVASVPEVVPAAEASAEAIDPAIWEEVNTKLDLARAYMEMGDKEGAREILQEVANEGDSTQKADAEKLLAEAG